MTMHLIDRPTLDLLFQTLKAHGYELIGPTVRDRAIVYDEIDTPDDLPVGWTDEHDGGHYRLKERSDRALFGYVVGPQSWKKFLFPPTQTLFRAQRTDTGMTIEPAVQPAPKRAFIGVRGCELAAMAIQDKVFTGGPFVDDAYKARRDNVFLLAVNCLEPGGTCFCTAMNTGPKVGPGFDLALTELIDTTRHDFVLEVGSDTGAALLAELSARALTDAEQDDVRGRWQTAAGQMGRQHDNSNIKELLYNNLEHPRWDDVAQRCLNCANCTLVCPTCFCSTVTDSTDLSGTTAERTRHWDSCFNQDFSYIVGGPVRESGRSRYRQWLTHKLASWYDQFGTSGCVGCGRCITWCPVGIDITAEVRAIRASQGA